MNNYYHSEEFKIAVKKAINEAVQMRSFFGKSTCVVENKPHEFSASILTNEISEDVIYFYFIWENEYHLMGNNGIRINKK
jgi:hypothetical protein